MDVLSRKPLCPTRVQSRLFVAETAAGAEFESVLQELKPAFILWHLRLD